MNKNFVFKALLLSLGSVTDRENILSHMTWLLQHCALILIMRSFSLIAAIDEMLHNLAVGIILL